MTSHTGRLYAVALALLIFFLTWAAVAARPWKTTQADPRIAALAAREQRIRHESLVVRRIVRRRWAVYRVRLKQRDAQIAAAKRAQQAAAQQAAAQQAAAQQAAAQQAQMAAAPAPATQVVNLPPLVVTRTS